jgi:hypothetical protein
MTKTTVSTVGEAMPAARLVHSNLIDEQTGELNRAVFKGLCRRRAMADYGALSPRALRSSLRFYKNLVDQLSEGWRMRHGLPVEMIEITPYGAPRDGVRRSAF